MDTLTEAMNAATKAVFSGTQWLIDSSASADGPWLWDLPAVVPLGWTVSTISIVVLAMRIAKRRSGPGGTEVVE